MIHREIEGFFLLNKPLMLIRHDCAAGSFDIVFIGIERPSPGLTIASLVVWTKLALEVGG